MTGVITGSTNGRDSFTRFDPIADPDKKGFIMGIIGQAIMSGIEDPKITSAAKEAVSCPGILHGNNQTFLRGNDGNRLSGYIIQAVPIFVPDKNIVSRMPPVSIPVKVIIPRRNITAAPFPPDSG